MGDPSGLKNKEGKLLLDKNSFSLPGFFFFFFLTFSFPLLPSLGALFSIYTTHDLTSQDGNGGLAYYSGLSHDLQCWHAMLECDTPLPNQCPINAPGRTSIDGSCHPHGGSSWGSRLLAFT